MGLSGFVKWFQPSQEAKKLVKIQSPTSPWIPIFGGRFARDQMFMFLNQFFAVQTQSSVRSPANYEIILYGWLGSQYVCHAAEQHRRFLEVESKY